MGEYYQQNKKGILEKNRIYMQKPENKKREAERRRLAYKTKPEVRQRFSDYHKKKYAENPEKFREQNRIKRQKIKLEVMSHYSDGKVICACCSENIIEFLAIDHINGNGGKHRKSLHGTNFYFWLKRNNFPLGFQVLCHNCNQAKGYFGECPHKKQGGM